jgi:peroxiredoxin
VPEALKVTAAKEKLSYTLLSDAEMNAAGAFGLAFRVDDATVKRYRTYGIKLPATHDGQYWLPVPAAYLVDAKGRIAFAHTDPDYKKRLSGAALLKAAKEITGK